MNHLKLLSRSGLAGLVLITGSTLGLLSACSSDDDSVPPVISTGGGGGGGKPGGEAGAGEAGAAGNTNSNGGTGASASDDGDAGQGGAAAGAAGEAGGPAVTPFVCPTTDLGFLNQTSTSQTSTFDNAKRLGAYTALPALGS